MASNFDIPPKIYLGDTAYAALKKMGRTTSETKTLNGFLNRHYARFGILDLPTEEARYLRESPKPRLVRILPEGRLPRPLRLTEDALAYFAALSIFYELHPERRTMVARASIVLEFIGLGWIK